MRKSNYLYKTAKAYLKDKDKAITAFIESALNKTQQMFSYTGLPETIPQSELEYIIQTKGHCIIAKHNNELYAFKGGYSGECDEYDRPRFYTVVNAALNLSRTYEIGVDCVLVKNDYIGTGLIPLISKYGVQLLDSELSLNVASVLARMTMLISAPDDKTKASADLFMQRILDGEYSIIGDNAFFDGIKMQSANTSNAGNITPLIELIQYYKASFLNELGLQANYNMKRERLTAGETQMAVDVLLPFIDCMYAERTRALSDVNDMFGTDIKVDYSSAWKVTHEHRDMEYAAVETDIEDNIEMSELSAAVEGGEGVENIEENNVEDVETNDENNDNTVNKTSGDKVDEETTDESEQQSEGEDNEDSDKDNKD